MGCSHLSSCLVKYIIVNILIFVKHKKPPQCYQH
nr:MAG TPA: hypothetical protein [Caudoviricetes sp.]